MVFMGKLIRNYTLMVYLRCVKAMVSFIQDSMNNALEMSSAAYTIIQGNRSPAIQTVLDYLFDPVANTGVGVLFATSKLLREFLKHTLRAGTATY